MNIRRGLRKCSFCLIKFRRDGGLDIFPCNTRRRFDSFPRSGQCFYQTGKRCTEKAGNRVPSISDSLKQSCNKVAALFGHDSRRGTDTKCSFETVDKRRKDVVLDPSGNIGKCINDTHKKTRDDVTAELCYVSVEILFNAVPRIYKGCYDGGFQSFYSLTCRTESRA